MNKTQEVKHISETIYGHMQKAYDEGFEVGTKTMQECSWEKGVRDAWEAIIHMLNVLGADDDIKREERAVMRAIAHSFEHTDVIDHTRSYVEMKNLKADDGTRNEEDKPVEVGDVVLDKSGNECVVTNTDTHIHVIYPLNGKTKKWNKNAEFKQTGRHIIGVGKMEM